MIMNFDHRRSLCGTRTLVKDLVIFFFFFFRYHFLKLSSLSVNFAYHSNYLKEAISQLTIKILSNGQPQVEPNLYPPLSSSWPLIFQQGG